MFNPNEHQLQCEEYLSRHLECRVELIKAKRLTKSSREVPWELEVKVDGVHQSYVLQVDPEDLELEYQVLKAMEIIPIPTPRAYGLELDGETLGIPCFFSDFIEGESLLEPILAGESWAEELFIVTVSRLQAVTEEQLGSVAKILKRETAADVLKEAYAYLKGKSLIADAVYKELMDRMPELPPVRFSNGDLWLENFIIKDKELTGVIDFTNAMFSDPIFEFLLSFFVLQELRGRGTEERYCHQMGYDPSILHWYHGLEYFDSLRWVMVTGEDYVHHTEESLKGDLQKWLEN